VSLIMLDIMDTGGDLIFARGLGDAFARGHGLLTSCHC